MSAGFGTMNHNKVTNFCTFQKKVFCSSNIVNVVFINHSYAPPRGGRPALHFSDGNGVQNHNIEAHFVSQLEHYYSCHILIIQCRGVRTIIPSRYVVANTSK